MINEILVSAITMSVIEFIFYFYLYKVKNLDIVLVRTYLLTLMVIIENIQIFNCRSERLSLFKIPGSNNRFLMISIIITLCLQVIIVRSQEMANVFNLSTIPIENIGILFLLSVPVVVVMEVFKRINKNVNILWNI